MKLAIIDLDGICANSNNREKQARQVATDGPEFWQAFLNPDFVPLDIPIAGAKEALFELERQGYQIVFLSSRPEAMREATEKWLLQHGFSSPKRRLVMKPKSAQFKKTPVWKASQVKALAEEFNATDILFVDDEPTNVKAVLALELPRLVAQLNFTV